MTDLQSDYRQPVERELVRNNIRLQPEALNRIGRFFHLLEQANRVVNLTGYSNLVDWIDFHLLDAIQIVERVHIPQEANVFDIGAGAGLPGVLIKCIRPDIRLIAVESVKKKADFIQSALQELGNEGDKVIAERAEVAAQRSNLRESGEIAIARALGSLSVSMELTAGFVRIGGRVILPRGERKPTEGLPDRFQEALGCSLVSMLEYRLPRRDSPFFLYEYEKTASLDAKYPRKPAQIKKRPL